MVCSTWAANLVWVLMGANWFLEGWSRPDGSNWHSTWSEKWRIARQSRALQAYIAFCLVLMVGLLWTADLGAGLSLLRVKLPLLVVPLVMLTTPPLEGRVRSVVLALFSGTVLVVSIIAAVRLFTIPDLPYRDAVPYISHIRFALCCCMVIFISCSGLCRHGGTQAPKLFSIHSAISAVVLLWMLCFLVLIRSYTAVAVLLVVSLAAVVHYRRRWWAVAVWLVLVGGGAAVVGHYVHDYYKPAPLMEEPLRECTAGGRPYHHAHDGIVENGNLLNNYICYEELHREWGRRSNRPLTEPMYDGYCLETVLIRHLNALGLTKDSAGVWAMNDAAVSAVERGVANPVYESRNPLRKMVYVMLFEREHYVHTRSVAGFTMLQRFELWRATWRVVRQHPLFGVGTGDAVGAMHAELVAMDSELIGTTKHTHCEYLSLLAMVGIVGVVVIVIMFLRPLLNGKTARGGMLRSPLMIAWLLTVLVSFLTEDTLDTLAGILFCTWFLAMRRGLST